MNNATDLYILESGMQSIDHKNNMFLISTYDFIDNHPNVANTAASLQVILGRFCAILACCLCAFSSSSMELLSMGTTFRPWAILGTAIVQYKFDITAGGTGMSCEPIPLVARRALLPNTTLSWVMFSWELLSPVSLICMISEKKPVIIMMKLSQSCNRFTHFNADKHSGSAKKYVVFMSLYNLCYKWTQL